MKNWCKIIETDTHDILVKKDYDQGEDMYGISVIIMIEESKVAMIEGSEITQTLWNKKEDVRDRLFDEMADEKYVSMVDDLLNQLTSL